MKKERKSRRTRAPGFLPCPVRKDGCDPDAFHLSSLVICTPPPALPDNAAAYTLYATETSGGSN